MTDIEKPKDLTSDTISKLKELRQIIQATTLLIIGSGGAFVVADMVADSLRNDGYKEFAVFFLVGLLLAVIMFAIGAFLVRMVEWRVVDIVMSSASTIKEATCGLKAATTGIVELQKQLNNIGQIVLLEDFDKLQKRFMEVTGLASKACNLDLRIVGTMLGTYGENSISLADSLIAGSDPSKQPFKTAYIGVPGHHKRGTEEDACAESSRSLYPFSARVTAGKILMAISKEMKEKKALKLHPDGLIIKIHFIPRKDIFPAIQMWGNQCAMVLSSTGAEDRNDHDNGEHKAVSNAMPVALVLKQNSNLHGEEKPINITNTLDRIMSHLESDYGLTNGGDSDLETWTLNEPGSSITVKNYKELHEQECFLRYAGSAGIEMDTISELKKNLAMLQSGKTLSIEDFETFINSLADATKDIACK